MNDREMQALMGDVAAVMKSLVSQSLSPIVERLDGIERRLGALPDTERRVREELADLRKTVEAIQPAPELPDVAGMISEAISLVPAPMSAEEVRALAEDVVAKAEKPAGVSAEEAEGIVAAAIEKALAGLPEPIPGPAGPKGDKGEDGKPGRDGLSVEDFDLELKEDGRTLVFKLTANDIQHQHEVTLNIRDGVDGAHGKDGAPGKDGANITESLIDRDGCLVLTLSNGSTRNVGRVVGRDGTDVDMAVVKSLLSDMVAAIPRPIDGKDGVGFEDMGFEVREDGAYLTFQRGDETKEFRIPTVIDRGVWREGKTYLPGDGVTWAGSFWICQEETSEKPDGGKGWRLAVKKGRDGKDFDPKGKP
jgi:hypothetical protein